MTLPGKLVDGTFTFLFLNPGDASGHFLSRGDAEHKVLAMSCDMRPAERCESSKIKVDGDMTVLASFRGCPWETTPWRRNRYPREGPQQEFSRQAAPVWGDGRFWSERT